MKNAEPFSRFFVFAGEFTSPTFYIVCTIFSLSIQLCLSCDRHFMPHIRLKAFAIGVSALRRGSIGLSLDVFLRQQYVESMAREK